MQYLTPRSLAIHPPSGPMILRLAPRRILTWVYGARFSLSAAIFLAAVFAWQHAPRASTLAATLIFATVMVVTVASWLYTEVYRQPISTPLLYSQMIFDVLVVTAIIHLTWDGDTSMFTPLYILIIAISALILPAKGVSVVSAVAIVAYSAEAILIQKMAVNLFVTLQLFVFGTVAVGSGYIAARLREAGLGREKLAQELARFRLKQADVERLHLRAERLEAVAELSASMAHEIKNPLASIRSAVEQIAESPRTTEDERVLTTLVQTESDRLARLLSRFLDFARVDVPSVCQLNVVDVVRNAAELVKKHPDCPQNVTIEYDISHVNLEIRGDEDMLHRAFFNLLLNAMQVSPENGVVRIEATTLLPHQLESHAPIFSRGAIAIRIVDQGPGVPESIRDKLFNPFFTTKKNGSGLGLAIVHRSIEFHKGVVVVDSDTNGSRFTVLLPKQ
jgi:signal transduction histidine kinase